MKILVVGGLPDSLVNFRGPLLKGLVNLGHEVVACASESDPMSGLTEVNITAALDLVGARFRAIPLERDGASPLKDWSTYRSLRAVMKEEKPDLVFAYTVKPVVYGSLSARRSGVPRIYSLITGLGRSFSPVSTKERMIFQVVRRLYQKALRANSAVFFQNPDDLEQFVQMGLTTRDKALITNGSGVNLSMFQVAPPVTKPITFLMVARLLKAKGVVEYVEACKLVRKKHSECGCILVGPIDKSSQAISESQIEQWVAEKAIDYRGSLRDVRPVMAESSVYVLPSYHEGTPRTVLEAMAIGRPIVTTDVSGCRETVVNNYNGYLVPPRNAEKTAEAMERFVTSPEQIVRMGQNSRQMAEDKYDVHKVNGAILAGMGLN